MIHRLYSTDLESFKNLTFGSGLNVLLAEKSVEATQKHTRNRAGKSSMVQLVDFLLGSSAEKDSLFRSSALAPYTFGMELDLAGTRVSVERTGSRPSPVAVAGELAGWPIAPRSKGDRNLISNTNWRVVLGELMLGLAETDLAYGPSFRSMISYFVRQEHSGGFFRATQQCAKQQLVDQQVNLSFLLGLDWSVPHAWHRVRQREKGLAQLKKSLKEGSLGQVIEKASTLKSQVVVAQDRLEQLRQRVASFKVVDEYHLLAQEASELSRKLAALSDESTLDRRYVAELEQTMTDEMPPAPADLQRLYKEAGVVLPDLVQKRFDAVETFHRSVIRNRRSYLQNEVESARSRIAERDEEQRPLDRRRAEIMGILSSCGALEHFTALQGEVARAEAELETLRKRHDAALALETDSLRLKMERSSLQERLRQDYSEQEGVVDEAILTFQRISSALYERSKAGSFSINPTDNGPELEIQIHGSKSKGVTNMQIFCFDMMLTLLCLNRGRGAGFLIHDSHLFDGVDERQVGKALALGARLAEENGFQYIVTLNTDAIPREVPPGFKIEDHTLDVRLSDATQDGGLFGFRFD